MSQNNMIQDANAQYFARPAQSLGAIEILPAGCGVTGWMIMEENEGCRTVAYRWREDLTRMHYGRAQAADRHQDLANQLVFRVEVQRHEIFSTCSKELGPVAQEKVPAIGETLSGPQRCRTHLPSERQGRSQSGCLPGSYSSPLADFLFGGHGQCRRGAEVAHQSARRSCRRGTRAPPPQDSRQERYCLTLVSLCCRGLPREMLRARRRDLIQAGLPPVSLTVQEA
jgi:hypothetical protein